ncbi:MAG: DUF6677 family protein [Terriglobales bacterium]
MASSKTAGGPGPAPTKDKAQGRAAAGARVKSTSPATLQSQPGRLEAWWVMAAGWAVPGLGYFLKRKWIRGALILISVAAMWYLGLAMQGQIYAFNIGDPLDILGWVGDFCAGALYFGTRMAGAGAGNAYTVIGNYGTMFLIAGGLLNLLAASDARDVYLGKKR